MRHRQEDSHAVYVRGNKDGNDAKHRHGHGHAVYVGSDGNSNKKWGVNNEVGHILGHVVQVKDVIENEDRTTNR